MCLLIQSEVSSLFSLQYEPGSRFTKGRRTFRLSVSTYWSLTKSRDYTSVVKEKGFYWDIY